ncbi:T9SS type A sorting domain-containing protein [Chryseobacterium chendengshani]|uniref:T9SS type A sorting domain-containing protein n=1 Tax=Chryseobacterium sp. LJ756 TaxID=2864113 RepID=UPI001C642E95|nr:T9SS type A sorting domain-containing protein [Chryseobacterium sp. LJ756]MBW7675115.1 T9SS type A sorting domain-containing protein [Chryseobacterium sp. LJ756]
MKRKILSIFSVFVGFLGYSQTEVYFKYDEAGNQRYRGTNANAKTTSKDIIAAESKVDTAKVEENTVATKPLLDDKTFWKQMRIYPVPVNDILTIDWTDELDELIATVSIYQHSTIHWKFQQQNLPNLNKQLKINMTGYDWGVYVLHVQLKDGRVFSRNITKR